MTAKTHRINITLSQDEFETLQFWSKKRGQSMSSLYRFMAKDCIDEFEEARLVKIIEERKNDPFISHEEAWK